MAGSGAPGTTDGGQQHRMFIISSSRGRPGSGQIQKRSRVRFGVISGFLEEPLQLAFRIGSKQKVVRFMVDGTNLLEWGPGTEEGDAVADALNTSRHFAPPSGETWAGFEIPTGTLGNTGGVFETDFVLANFNLVFPEFQIMPVIMTLKSKSFESGHYIVGASVLAGRDGEQQFTPDPEPHDAPPPQPLRVAPSVTRPAKKTTKSKKK